ncbi:L-amino-acid oxidase isoform X2 [Takifugu rubripes]|uniref:Amine oxidase n=2 Tax=Takifugu rubripes TaxID=31033 RepID=H2U223_TAKRU|nr:L-amino-acid oxidase isoform X2 [Takifugu rubripes]XP_029699255.1 L-amino-acid oxidase isoform X2 [Takifugu rubripes]XP_029699256.1 L-amino-acid oxidase isoform X2 [Takifugu rubripes]
MIPHTALCTFFPLALVGVVVFAVGGIFGDPLFECLQDADYSELLDIVEKGLPATKSPRHVAIVGGGIAGLTAAKFLEDAGHKVTIIEASHRTGGRVETFRNRKEGWYVEVGAMRIPSFHKILLSFAAKLQLSLDHFVQDDINTYYFVNGGLQKTYAVEINPSLLNYPLAEQERGKSAAQLFGQALQKVRDDLVVMGCRAMLGKYDSYSVKEYLVKEGNLSRGALRMIGDILNENSLFYMSLVEMLYIQSDINDKTEYFEVTDGFEHLTNSFYRLLNATILLNSKVKLIDQSGGTNVRVAYQDRRNSGSLSNLTVDYVLVTPTAKATLFIDFKPPLSGDKMEALRSVHYASSTKVVLSFSERFWEKDGIRGGKSITDRPSRFIHYPSHAFSGTAGGALLASYTCSDDSTLFQGMNDDELMAVVLEDLVKIHGERIRPLWTGGLVKKWGLDPYSLGAFALFTPYQQGQYAGELFESEGRVHFAGEHTATPHGWIETAMKSALRAARNINKLTL